MVSAPANLVLWDVLFKAGSMSADKIKRLPLLPNGYFCFGYKMNSAAPTVKRKNHAVL
jgi:hypothetical protein